MGEEGIECVSYCKEDRSDRVMTERVRKRSRGQGGSSRDTQHSFVLPHI